MDIKLSKDFNLSEFLYSTSVESLKRTIPSLYKSQNFVDFSIVENLRFLVQNVLQPIRSFLGLPIKINSGYRCPSLNKRVGGSSTSQHLEGLAADITCSNNIELLKIIKSFLTNYNFDQVIVYGDKINPRFIHVSTCYANCRHQLLYKD